MVVNNTRINNARINNSRINNTRIKKNKKKRYNRSKGTKKVTNNKNFKKASCAPSTEKKDFTCYSDNSLMKMKNL